MSKNKFLILLFILMGILFTSCIIDFSEEEFYAIQLNGSWLRENETVRNNSETLTFIDLENLKYRLNNDTIYYKFSFYFDELSIYNTDDSLIGKCKVEIFGNNKKFEIKDTLNNKFHLLNGIWKKYQ